MNTILRRSGLTVIAVAATLLLAAPAEAKAPATTWEVTPTRPLVGVPTTIVLRTWEWNAEGEADTSRPSAFFSQRQASRFFAAYPPDDRGACLRAKDGIPLTFRETAPAEFKSTVVFSMPGTWKIDWVGSLACNVALLEVEVQRTSGAIESSDQEGGVHRAVGPGMAAIVGGAVFLAVRRRQTDR